MFISISRRPYSLKLVVSVSLILTLLIGISHINSMLRIESMGIYDLKPVNYISRLILLFIISFSFLSVNLLIDKISIATFKVELKKLFPVIVINLIVFIILQAFIILLILSQFQRIAIQEGVDIDSIFGVMAMVTTTLALMTASILIGRFYHSREENFQMKLANEKLSKAFAEARYQQLKEQLNPHFLFNSFSTLDGLIVQSEKKAKLFVHHLSDLYRYILQTEKLDTVTLKEEMEFAANYLSIAKERFGDSIQQNFDITERDLRKKVPPQAVQMLVENAIKHNQFNKDQPLNLSIRSGQTSLEIKNNLKPRKVAISHSFGLHNLNQRYLYLSGQEILIKKTASHFIVQIPFIT